MSERNHVKNRSISFLSRFKFGAGQIKVAMSTFDKKKRIRLHGRLFACDKSAHTHRNTFVEFGQLSSKLPDYLFCLEQTMRQRQITHRFESVYAIILNYADHHRRILEWSSSPSVREPNGLSVPLFHVILLLFSLVVGCGHFQVCEIGKMRWNDDDLGQIDLCACQYAPNII